MLTQKCPMAVAAGKSLLTLTRAGFLGLWAQVSERVQSKNELDLNSYWECLTRKQEVCSAVRRDDSQEREMQRDHLQ